MKSVGRVYLGVLAWAVCAAGAAAGDEAVRALTYRRFTAEVKNDRVLSLTPVPDAVPPRWARDVAPGASGWASGAASEPLFAQPIPFVLPPADEGEPFHPHNHQPSIAWLPNGDLLAVWYSTGSEEGAELTVLASRLRAGSAAWDPSSEFFRAPNCNMHGSVVWHDGKGTVYHFNGMGRERKKGYDALALLLRTSRDSGVTWTPPRAIEPRFAERRRVIQPTFANRDGALIQPCDARPVGSGGTALLISRDGGETWRDPGEGKPKPVFQAGAVGQGTAAGIHAGVVELLDGRLMALGRGDNITDADNRSRMPMSVSADLGETWSYRPSPFCRVGTGQRLALMRLREGPLLFVGFTSSRFKEPLRYPTPFAGADGRTFIGHGLYAALSFDEGATWPLMKLLTPGDGSYDGGAHHRKFVTASDRAEPAGYLAATQAPDGVIHLVSSRLHYRFNFAWLKQGWVSRP